MCAGLDRGEPWAADDIEDLNQLCDWLLEPGAQDAAPSPKQPEQPARRLAATFPTAATPLAPAAVSRPAAVERPASVATAPPCAVALESAGAPLASPFAAASLQTVQRLQTPCMAPPQHTRLRPAASAPAPISPALSWVLAIAKLANSPPLDCQPSRPPSPPLSGHPADLPAPRPAHSDRSSLEHTSSTHNHSPPLCTAETPSHSLDLLDLLGAEPLPQAAPPPPLAPRSSAAAAAPYRGIGTYGVQRSAPLPQLPAYGSSYERLPAARALPAAPPPSAAGLHRAASASIGRKRLCTWDEHPAEDSECWVAPKRCPSMPAPPPAWQPARQLSAPLPAAWPPPAAAEHPPASLPPAWQQAAMQRQPSLEESLEAQRQKLSSLLAQLQQVRVALQHEAAPLPLPQLPPAPTAPLPHAQRWLAPPTAPQPLHHPGLQAGHLSWPAGAPHCEPSPFFSG